MSGRIIDPEVQKALSNSTKTTAETAAELQRLLNVAHVPKDVLTAIQRLEGSYRKALEEAVTENLHGRQREQILREQLRLAEASRQALQEEGSGIKSEWESMYKEVKDARQQHAVLDARNKFLEKADEARRLLHVDLRDTQRRLTEAQDQNLALQEEAARTQMELEQQIHDLTVIQDELGHLLRQERLKADAAVAELTNAKKAAATSNQRVATLLDEKSVFEDEVDKLASALHECLEEKTVVVQKMTSLQREFLSAKQDAAGKITELVNNVDTMVNVIAQHARSKIRHGGGFKELGPLLERECRREIDCRTKLANNASRFAAKVHEVITIEAEPTAQVAESPSFDPFGQHALYSKLKSAASSLAAASSAEQDMTDHPWGHRILFRPETAPIWTSVHAPSNGESRRRNQAAQRAASAAMRRPDLARGKKAARQPLSKQHRQRKNMHIASETSGVDCKTSHGSVNEAARPVTGPTARRSVDSSGETAAPLDRHFVPENARYDNTVLGSSGAVDGIEAHVSRTTDLAEQIAALERENLALQKQYAEVEGLSSAEPDLSALN